MRLDTSCRSFSQNKPARILSPPNQKLAGEGITWRYLGTGPGTASVAAFCIASLRSHNIEDVRPSLLSYRLAWLDRPAPRRRILRLCGTACTRQTARRWLAGFSRAMQPARYPIPGSVSIVHGRSSSTTVGWRASTRDISAPRRLAKAWRTGAKADPYIVDPPSEM